VLAKRTPLNDAEQLDHLAETLYEMRNELDAAITASSQVLPAADVVPVPPPQDCQLDATPTLHPVKVNSNGVKQIPCGSPKQMPCGSPKAERLESVASGQIAPPVDVVRLDRCQWIMHLS
jgi:hypothetical protein